MVRATCEVHVSDIKRAKDTMSILSLIEEIDQLVMVNSVCWYGYVLRRNNETQ